MAHHGINSEDLIAQQLFAERMGWREEIEKLNLGPTGRFPEGKLNDSDEGEIRVAIGYQEGKVIMDFGKPIAWIGFTPEQAREIAATLIGYADGVG
jgi:hypothetical protein